MLRTNSKKAADNIDQYILTFAEDIRSEHEFDDELGCGFKYDLSSIAGVSDYILNACFHECYVKHNKQYAAGMIGLSALFAEYAQGLPLPVFDYYLFCNARDILGDILEETEEERSRYTEEAAAELLTKLIYRQITKYATLKKEV